MLPLDRWNSLYWATYRSRMPPQKGIGDLSSDTGFGCTIRSCQSLLASTIFLCQTSKYLATVAAEADARGDEEKVVQKEIFDNIRARVAMFVYDMPYDRCIFSLQSFLRIGQRMNKSLRSWWGPHEACIAAVELSQRIDFAELGIRIVACTDGMVCESDFQVPPPLPGVLHTEPPMDNSPTLVLVPIRVGLNYVPPHAMYTLADCMQSPWFCGFFGGTPRHSLFIVGLEPKEDTISIKKALQRFIGLGGRVEYPWRFVVLDPHYTKPYPLSGYEKPRTKPPAQFVESLSPPCFTKRETMDPDSLDPSLALGFYLPRGLKDYPEWKSAMDQIGCNTDSRSKMWAMLAQKEEREKKKGAFETLAEQYRMFSKGSGSDPGSGTSKGTPGTTNQEDTPIARPGSTLQRILSAGRFSTDSSTPLRTSDISTPIASETDAVNTTADANHSTWNDVGGEINAVAGTEHTVDTASTRVASQSQDENLSSRKGSSLSYFTSSFSNMYRKSNASVSGSVHSVGDTRCDSAVAGSSPGSKLSFDVHDSGPGVPPQISESIHAGDSSDGNDQDHDPSTGPRAMENIGIRLSESDSSESQQALEAEAYKRGFGFRLFTFVNARPGADDFTAFGTMEPMEMSGATKTHANTQSTSPSVQGSHGTDGDDTDTTGAYDDPYAVLSDVEVWDDSDFSLEMRKTMVHSDSCTSPTGTAATRVHHSTEDDNVSFLSSSAAAMAHSLSGGPQQHSVARHADSTSSVISPNRMGALSISVSPPHTPQQKVSPYPPDHTPTDGDTDNHGDLATLHSSIETPVSEKPRSDSYDLVEFSPAFSARPLYTMSSVPSITSPIASAHGEHADNPDKDVPVVPSTPATQPQETATGFVTVPRDPFRTAAHLKDNRIDPRSGSSWRAGSPTMFEHDYEDLGKQDLTVQGIDRQDLNDRNMSKIHIAEGQDERSLGLFPAPVPTAPANDVALLQSLNTPGAVVTPSSPLTPPVSLHPATGGPTAYTSVTSEVSSSMHSFPSSNETPSSEAVASSSSSSSSAIGRPATTAHIVSDASSYPGGQSSDSMAQHATHNPSSSFSSSSTTASRTVPTHSDAAYTVSRVPPHPGPATVHHVNSDHPTSHDAISPNVATSRSIHIIGQRSRPVPSITASPATATNGTVRDSAAMMAAKRTPLPASVSIASSNDSSSSSTSQSSKAPPTPPTPPTSVPSSPEIVPYASLLSLYPDHSLLQETVPSNRRNRANGDAPYDEHNSGMLSSLWKSIKKAPGVQYFANKE